MDVFEHMVSTALCQAAHRSRPKKNRSERVHTNEPAGTERGESAFRLIQRSRSSDVSVESHEASKSEGEGMGGGGPVNGANEGALIEEFSLQCHPQHPRSMSAAASSSSLSTPPPERTSVQDSRARHLHPWWTACTFSVKGKGQKLKAFSYVGPGSGYVP